MKTAIHAIIAIVILYFQNGTASGAEPAADLVVHEWGTFTTIAGEDGRPVQWRPLSLDEQLPSFVHDAYGRGRLRGTASPSATNKGEMSGTVRMETPVLYFYADREMTVSLKVDFPGGVLTEWYPHARWIHQSPSYIDWGVFKILPDASPPFLRDFAPSNYYAARQTDAAAIRICGPEKTEYEKFLFYRGVGTFDQPLNAVLEDEDITVHSDVYLPAVVVFESNGEQLGFNVYRNVEERVTFERPRLDDDLNSILSTLRGVLEGEGLYAQEAQAMVETWRHSWFEEGLRLFYAFPQVATDAVLPLAIAPGPSELVRVMVARVEIITPEMEAEVEDLVGRLMVEPECCPQARTRLVGYGRFLEPICRRIAARRTNFPTSKQLAERLGLGGC